MWYKQVQSGPDDVFPVKFTYKLHDNLYTTIVHCMYNHPPQLGTMGYHPGRYCANAGLTYRLQLVHEFDQELSALWCFTVQLHACLHSVEPTYRRGQEGGERRDERWTELNIFSLLCKVHSSTASFKGLAESYGRLITQSPDEFFTTKLQSSPSTADVSFSSATDQTQNHTGPGGKRSKRFPSEPPQAGSYREDSLSELQLPQSLICQLVLQSDSSLHMM